MIVDFKKLKSNAVIPVRGSELAAGWDVSISEIEYVEDGFVICKLGFATRIPDGYKIMLVPRSSLTKTKWLIQNSPCTIDEDYRGEYQVRLRCIPSGIDSENKKLVYDKFPFDVGDRVGQLFLEKVIPIEFNLVEELDETKRGDGGFGSTNI